MTGCLRLKAADYLSRCLTFLFLFFLSRHASHTGRLGLGLAPQDGARLELFAARALESFYHPYMNWVEKEAARVYRGWSIGREEKRENGWEEIIW